MDNKNNHNNTHNSINVGMEANTTIIKVKFQNSCRNVQLPVDTTTVPALLAAVRSAFKLPDKDAAVVDEISLTYRDPDGDAITFDKDSELALALRLCPSPLEVTAAYRPPGQRKKVSSASHRLVEVIMVDRLSDPKKSTRAPATLTCRQYRGNRTRWGRVGRWFDRLIMAWAAVYPRTFLW